MTLVLSRSSALTWLFPFISVKTKIIKPKGINLMKKSDKKWYSLYFAQILKELYPTYFSISSKLSGIFFPLVSGKKNVIAPEMIAIVAKMIVGIAGL